MLGSMFNFNSLIVAAIVLGVIIVIHELGHFMVAKFFRIKVETFSVGFGPRLIGFRRGDTDYRISAFPLGGYVKMAGETPADTITGEAYEFLSKPKWQRFLVAAAGPAMNAILAIGLITGLYVYGTDVPEYLLGQVAIGIVEPGSPAEHAGLKPGDQIVSFDGKEKPDWQDIETAVLTSPGRPIPIVVERGSQKFSLTVTPQRKGREEAGDVGMEPVVRNVIRSVEAESPAATAGIKPGDEIIRVNGVDLRTGGRTIQQIIQTSTEKTFPVTVLRPVAAPETHPAPPPPPPGFWGSLWRTLTGSRSHTAVDVVSPALGNLPSPDSERKEVDFQVSPRLRDGRRMIGVAFVYPTVQIKLGLVDAFKKSLETNKENAVLIFQVIGRLLKREASLKQLDGPVGIISVSGQAYEAGFTTLLTFMALISLNLGVLNILPIPILDGGLILMLLVEAVMGRDLSLRMKERIVQASFVFLLMLTVVVLYNDVVKLLPTQPTP